MSKFKSIRIGRAFVEIDTNRTKFDKGLAAAEARLKNFSAFATKAGGILAGAGGALAAGFIPAIKAASDMEETMNKFNVVFGESKDRVKEWSDNFAGEIGRSKKQIADFMASSQDLFVPLGFEAGAAEEMSKQLTGLSIDLASFNNMQDADVLRDLHAALTGSGEVMKKYGVIVSEAAVKQELLNQGLDPKTADNAAKVQARLNIILRGTTAAQGDAARSAGSFANQMKALKASAEDTKVAIGQALLPVVTPLVGKVREAAQVFQKWAEENPTFVKTLAMVASGVAAAGVALLAIGAASNAAAAGIAALNVSMTALAAHSAKFAAIIPLLVAFFLARHFYTQNEDVKAFNAELKKSIELNSQLLRLQGKRGAETLAAAAKIEDPKKRLSFLEKELARVQLTAAAKAGNVSTSEKRLETVKGKWLNKAIDPIYGSADIESAENSLAEARSQHKAAKEQEQAIIDAINAEKRLAEARKESASEAENATKEEMESELRKAAGGKTRVAMAAGTFGQAWLPILEDVVAKTEAAQSRAIRDKTKAGGLAAAKALLPSVGVLATIGERVAAAVSDRAPAVEKASEELTKADEKIQKRESLNVGLSEQQTEFLKGQAQRTLAERAFKDTATNTGRAAQLLEEIAGRDGITVSGSKEGF